MKRLYGWVHGIVGQKELITIFLMRPKKLRALIKFGIQKYVVRSNPTPNSDSGVLSFQACTINVENLTDLVEADAKWNAF